MRTPDTRPFRCSLIAAVCIVVIALAGACGTAELPSVGRQGAAPSPTYDPNEFALTPTIPLPTKGPRTSPVPEPTQDPNAGVSVGLSGTFINPSSPEQFDQWYGFIVSCTDIQMLPAQWSTPDGKRPPDVSQENIPDTYKIVTPAVVKLDGAPLVNRLGAEVSSGQIVATTFGGQIGKDQMTIDDPVQHLQVGQHVLLGLTDQPIPSGTGQARYVTPAGLSWNVGMVYTLTDDGKAIPVRFGGQPVAAQEFIAAIVSAATKR
jgi:hypothetical protein